PFALAGCAITAPVLPGGPAEDPRWFDTRIEMEAASTSPSDRIPETRLDPAEQAALVESARRMILLRNSTQADERAEPVSDAGTEDFADQARDRSQPPD